MINQTINSPTIRFNSCGVEIEGLLDLPKEATSIVVFVHGSGSSRHSVRNQQVARTFQDHGMGTLLVDLLTTKEEREDLRSGGLRFDVESLAERVTGIIDWLNRNHATEYMKLGLIGSSTGAAAALIAAAKRVNQIQAVVSRGGRPDLARACLPRVQTPTLLIVGGNDTEVLELNEEAYALLSCPKRLEVIEGATHLFEEPGTLVQAANAASTWFLNYL